MDREGTLILKTFKLSGNKMINSAVLFVMPVRSEFLSAQFLL